MSEKIRWFRYVPHHRKLAYQALGWIDTGDLVDTHHGFYSEIMQWPFPTDPVEPVRDE